MLNEINDHQLAYIKLWYLVQHSLSAYQKLIQHFGSAQDAVQKNHLNQWHQLNLHKNHIERASQFFSDQQQQEFERILHQIHQHSDFMLTEQDPDYPQQLMPYHDRPPILFGKGKAQHLSEAQIAIVGSRKPSPHGKQVAYDFAYYLSDQGFYITSGLAQGIDEAAHQGALQHGKTIAVIGTGLDLIYPSQNRPLHDQILKQNGTIISEFLPGTKPLQHNFPRRNRIVSGLSLGILVAEAQLGSGSLITAQAAANQGKTTFAIPGHIYSEFHQGCHQLIREGAILVDHPEQIIEDLALPTQWQHQQASLSRKNNPNEVQNDEIAHSVDRPKLSKYEDDEHSIPIHLLAVFQQLDWVGRDLDQIAATLDLDTATLTSHLMELELLGRCIQQSGLYLRCRN
ncbi:DNA-processing protein DprA [Acinetobacter sp. YH12239]|uniref:DNA-processing protein DprA n=1 Tax=Acinetobacter sp. YH12239 TaxID=2601166 RepID=UPI0015D1A14B|nr:DNA-processing protein DprA [Acinetobacter sp. YH12239]